MRQKGQILATINFERKVTAQAEGANGRHGQRARMGLLACHRSSRSYSNRDIVYLQFSLLFDGFCHSRLLTRNKHSVKKSKDEVKSITHDTTNTATKPQKKKRMRDRQQVAARNSEMGLQLRIPAPRTTPWPFLSSLQNPPTQNAQEAPVLIKPCQPTSNMSTCRVANLSSSHKISTPQPRRATPPPSPTAEDLSTQTR